MANPPIRAGNLDGLGSVYSDSGGLMPADSERLLRSRGGCELAVFNSWRVLGTKAVFSAMPAPFTGKLFVTDRRLVFIREIDVWKEVKPLMTPFGIPAGLARDSKLGAIKARGGRQYCEMLTSDLRLHRARHRKKSTDMYLEGSDGRRYEVYLYTDVKDPEFYAFVEGRFSGAFRGG